MRTWSKKTSLRITPIPTQPKRMHGLLRRSFCMSKKNLNADGLLNELKGGSSFFPSKPEEPAADLPQIPPLPLRETHILTQTTAKEASLHASKHASTLAR